MIRKITIALALLALVILVTGKLAFTHDGNSPSGHANDPASGYANCTACHGGTAATVTGWITSNIPSGGYVPGTTYTITATSTGTGGNKGFQVSPQSSTGAFLGTLIAGTGTGLVGSNHYIHSTGSGITTNPKTWTFQWTAPATGLGPVGFYGAFAIGTGTTKITSYIVNESTTGITENKATSGFSIYPNPATDNINVSYSLTDNSNVEINLFSAEGKKIAQLQSSKQNAGSYNQNLSIKDLNIKGIFIVELKIGEKSIPQKLLVY